jgi:hypothetical protein
MKRKSARSYSADEGNPTIEYTGGGASWIGQRFAMPPAKMLARPDFDVSRCAVMRNRNARANTQGHTPPREHFCMDDGGNQNNAGLFFGRGKNARACRVRAVIAFERSRNDRLPRLLQFSFEGR